MTVDCDVTEDFVPRRVGGGCSTRTVTCTGVAPRMVLIEFRLVLGEAFARDFATNHLQLGQILHAT